MAAWQSATTAGRRARAALIVGATLVATAATATVGAGTAGAGAAAPASASGGPPMGHSFYVSPGGSDQASGMSPGRAFRHVQRCADLAQPGDTCYLMSGTYRETVRPARSGTPGRPITYAPYRGAHAAVSGLQSVAGWHRVTRHDLSALEAADPLLAASDFAGGASDGHVYRAHVPGLGTGLSANQLLVDGQMLPEAQWPYPGLDLLRPRFELTQPGSAGPTIIDPKLTQPAGYWAGAKIHATQTFVADTGTVADSQPGRLTIGSMNGSAALLSRLNANQGTFYSLYGTLRAMSGPGQWFFDRPSGTLYLWPLDGRSPSGRHVQTKARNVAFDFDGISDTVVHNLAVTGATIVTDDASSDDVLSGLDVTYPSHYMDVVDPGPAGQQTPDDGYRVITDGELTTGIQLHGTHNTVRDSTIAYSAGNGVLVGGHDNTVTNNVIHDVDYRGTYAAGIDILAGGNTVTHNSISAVGRSAVSIDWHIAGTQIHDLRIAYNDMYDYARLNVDNGALYVCCQLDLSGTSIDHNWGHDFQGPPGTQLLSEAGIYLDNSSGHALIHHNVVWNNVNSGIHINGSFTGPSVDNLIYSNTSAGGQEYSVQWQGVSTGVGTDVRDNILGLHQTISSPPADATVAHNLGSDVDPQLVDPAHEDFRLRPGSPAIDAGVPIPGITDGYRGAAPDLGAYEYGAPRWTAGAVLTDALDVDVAPAFPGASRPYVLPATTQRVTVGLDAAGRRQGTGATVRLRAPAGWHVSPARPQRLRSGGRHGADATWAVTPPRDVRPGGYFLRATGSVRGGGKARPVSGAASVVVPPPAPTADAALSDLPWVDAITGYQLVHRDLQADGKTIIVGGVSYPKGFGVVAPSRLGFYLGGRCTQFRATVGVDKQTDVTAGGGTVSFQVLGDGRVLFDSGLMTRDQARKVALDIHGVHELALLVHDGGDGGFNDRADWANPTVTCS